MKKKLLSAIVISLFSNCQNHDGPLNYTNNNTNKPKTGFVENSEHDLEKNLVDVVEEKKASSCIVDMSDNFIPELLEKSVNKKKYFTITGTLANPLQRERFGIFSSFEHYVRSLNSDNKSEEDHRKDYEGILRVLEERIFHANCLLDGKERHPYVLEQKELTKLVESTAKQLGIDSLEGTKKFFEQPKDKVLVHLEIPERYKHDSLNLEIEVIKSKKDRKKTTFILYAVEEKEKVELLRTRAVVGGGKRPNTHQEFNTPARTFYMKSVIIMPHWIPPPQWARVNYGDISTLPGPYNAFGMFASDLYYDNKKPENIYARSLGIDDGFRLHLTSNPSSVENGGYSHGCVRIHPNLSRVFNFITEYTPHGKMKEHYRKGEVIPFTENFIKVIVKE
ncbi:MAG: L,D-transpeptidase [Nanoarchaeota archaeon]|nr:L,D-transpeptidase [Nanoarchaeota archaeon]MBU1643679.1 L,D-transpeptidase [Nanoarchaeota archaeon]MBU1976777.1 L,D-transpeptidase [Nanoarchaeota archaeon]